LAVAANTIFLSPKWGLNRGFQVYDVKAPVEIVYSDLRRRVRGLLNHFISTTFFDSTFLDAAEVNQEVFRLLDSSTAGRPFLLFVNYMDAHVPYGIAPRSLEKRFPVRRHSRYTTIENEVIVRKQAMPEEEREALISDYDRGIAYEDDSLSLLFDWLKQRGLYDNTLILVTSDHGEAFGEHQLVGHGTLVYEDEVHVPLLVKYPGQTAARRVDAPVSHVDLMPTVLDCLGIRAPAQLQGRSLWSDGLQPDRTLFAESFPLEYFSKMDPRLNRIERAMRQGSWKLIVSSSGRHALYDLADDPAETHDLYAANPAEAQKLSALFYDWECRLPRPSAVRPGVDESTLKRLKSLGYLQ